MPKGRSSVLSSFTRSMSVLRVWQSKTKFEGKPVKDMFRDFRVTREVLGQGTYSQVKMAFDHDGQGYAIKILKKEGQTPDEIQEAIKEVKLMKTLIHPNIVRFHEFYEDSGAIYIVMEYCTEGELFKEIEMRKRFTEEDAKEYVKLLVNALKYCYDKGIVHRDIKPDNILLQGNGSGAKKVMLADFGFATKVDPHFAEFTLLQTQCGTPNYVAPEIIDNKPYNYKCDIWSLGVVIYVMMSGYLPFAGKNKGQLFGNIQKGKFKFAPDHAWEKVSDNAKDFISRLICRDADERISYEEMLEHPWIASEEKSLEDLTDNLRELREFNTRRKVYAATKALEAAAVFRSLMGSSISMILGSNDEDEIQRFQDAMDSDSAVQLNVPVPMKLGRTGAKAKPTKKKKSAWKNQPKGYFSFFKRLETDLDLRDDE